MKSTNVFKEKVILFIVTVFAPSDPAFVYPAIFLSFVAGMFAFVYMNRREGQELGIALGTPVGVVVGMVTIFGVFAVLNFFTKAIPAIWKRINQKED